RGLRRPGAGLSLQPSGAPAPAGGGWRPARLRAELDVVVCPDPVDGRAGELTMPYVTTVDGIRAYYDLAGSGPALVMVHGASQDSLSWQYVIDLFAPHYTVHA